MAKSDNSFSNNDIDNDLTSLLNQINEDDPIFEELNAINELLKEADNSSLAKEKGLTKEESPKDVGDIFSDALSAVSSLDDISLVDIDNIDLDLTESNDSEKTEVKDKKTGLFKKGKREKNKKNKKDKPKKEKIRKTKQEKIKDKQSSEELIEEEQEDKGKKKRKPKKIKEKKIKEKKIKPKKEKVKKEKIKKDKPSFFLIDEIDDTESSINKFASIAVFFILFLLVILLFIGTNLFNYTLSIKRATEHFSIREYNEAFDEIYGVDVKDKDIEIYDKIITVMYVNKQLNSYNNYYAAQMYDASLDSLLKGLLRYEKYIDLATLLGIEDDLDYVRQQILAELKNVFGISENEARRLMTIENKAEYSKEILNIVSN